MKYYIQCMWTLALCPLWSVVINLCYWARHIKDLRVTIKHKHKLEAIIKNESIYDCPITFRWQKDTYKDWQPWVITLVHKRFKDDCDGAAVLAKWVFALRGIPSNILSLYDRDFRSGHKICLAKDHSSFMTNGYYVAINASSYKQDIFDYFNNKYSIIIGG